MYINVMFESEQMYTNDMGKLFFTTFGYIGSQKHEHNFTTELPFLRFL
jgi:hypothetical protein